MAYQWKRPLNVDVKCGLRVMGWAKNSFTFESDEGDGYDIIAGYMEGEGPALKQHYYEEWAEQLSYAAEWCHEQARRKAKELQTASPNKCKPPFLRKLWNMIIGKNSGCA